MTSGVETVSTFKTRPCKACKRPIHFVQTVSGKLMPCEVEEVSFVIASDVAIEGALETFITLDGETKRGIRMQTRTAKTFIGYVPHWQNCPKFKRTRK